MICMCYVDRQVDIGICLFLNEYFTYNIIYCSQINKVTLINHFVLNLITSSPSPPYRIGDSPKEPSLVLILKWGGELTPAGRIQAEELGRIFRCMYPGGQGTVLIFKNISVFSILFLVHEITVCGFLNVFFCCFMKRKKLCCVQYLEKKVLLTSFCLQISNFSGIVCGAFYISQHKRPFLKSFFSVVLVIRYFFIK